ncbi:hypothetical protein M231_07331 [Tremella mesenterica]|uniref:VPS37 C-terminal domain-containing protein n=1 Tax=Tremella mesenterica TaxID=5217 RepID=A0A4Q1BBI3_TREME|nr:hypothetical protein M231_07331 [Tremella mesenterica]
MSTPLLQQFPSLAAYPPAFLKDLLSSPQLTEAFLFTLPEVQELAGEVERLGRENHDLANKNLSLRDELLALRDGTAQSYAHAEYLKRRWVELEKIQNQLYQKHRPSFLHLRLRHSLTAQDDLSEKMANAFIEGKNGYPNGQTQMSVPGSRVESPIPGSTAESTPTTSAMAIGNDRSQNKAIDDFINDFKAARKTYHKRAIWTERWSRGEVAWRDD